MSARLRAAARALNAAGWTCYAGSDEPGRYDECADCRRVCDEVAAKVLAAADEIDRGLGPGWAWPGDDEGSSLSRQRDVDAISPNPEGVE